MYNNNLEQDYTASFIDEMDFSDYDIMQEVFETLNLPVNYSEVY